MYNNVEKQRAGTEAEDVGAGSRSSFIDYELMYLSPLFTIDLYSQ